MAQMSGTQLVESMYWRYATQGFDPAKKIPKADLETLLQSMNLAPTSYGIQPFHFRIVENQEIKDKLKAASWNQSQVSDCSHLVVLTTLKQVRKSHVDEYMARIVKARGVERERLNGFADSLMRDLVNREDILLVQAWCQKQAYISMGFLMLSAALLHIDSCPLEGLNPIQYDEILGITDGDFSTAAAVALGYRADTDVKQTQKKVRMTPEELFTFVR